MKTVSAKTWRRMGKALVVVALLATAWQAGMGRLEGWSGPASSLTNDLFIPAIMMNAGHGFCNADASAVPELRAFLDFRAQQFDLENFADRLVPAPTHPYQEFHRYLIYSVALAWRFQGVSWDALKPLILLYFLAACLMVYGICRLAMNPLFSFLVAAAFVHARPVLWTLPLFRDFAKAPFILGVALLLGIVICRRLAPRSFFGIALLLGLLLGLGMGVRRDVMVFVPMSILFLFFADLRCGRHAYVAKAGAALLLVVVFFVAGFPIHRALAREGYLAAHDTIMGFASYSDHELGVIEPASYEKHYLLNDMYATLQARRAAAHADVVADDEAMKSAYVRRVVSTFSADMVMRACGAVLRIASGMIAAPRSPERFGLWFLAAALMMVAWRHPVRAWLMLALVCCFCGYTSLQFAFRHAFHMSFVPFFFMGFVAQHSLLLFTRIIRRTDSTAPSGEEAPPASRGRVFVFRCVRTGAWVLVTVIAFALPLHIAGVIQEKQVLALRDAYTSTDLKPLSHHVLHWNGRVVCAPREQVAHETCEDGGILSEFALGVLVAEFDRISAAHDVRAVYEWAGGVGDFGGPLHVVPGGNGSDTGGMLFVPVYEQRPGESGWSRFVGLSMNEDTSASFRGFHRVETVEELGLLVNIIVPNDPERFLTRQRLVIPWKGGRLWTPYYPFGVEYDLPGRAQSLRARMEAGGYDEALPEITEAIELYPGSLLLTMLLAETLKQRGESDAAEAVCRELRSLFPESPAIHAQTECFLQEQGDVHGCSHFWSANCLSASCPKSVQELRHAAVKLRPAMSATWARFHGVLAVHDRKTGIILDSDRLGV